uniref:Uncharacterized protein n=1 Tax=Anguilla anguilla TaxID=7936 RepID=A0A0E9TWL9_ANGAN
MSVNYKTEKKVLEVKMVLH